MIVYHHYSSSRGSVGSNPGIDRYVEVRPENEAEEKLLMSLTSGAIHIGHGDWRLCDQTVKHIGGRPMNGGPSQAYKRLRNIFDAADHCNIAVI